MSLSAFLGALAAGYTTLALYGASGAILALLVTGVGLAISFGLAALRK